MILFRRINIGKIRQITIDHALYLDTNYFMYVYVFLIDFLENSDVSSTKTQKCRMNISIQSSYL